MKKYLIPVLIVCLFTLNTIAQNTYKSIHQEESEKYKAIGKDADYYEQTNLSQPVLDNASAKNASTCTLQKKVYGWHPYWMNGVESNYQWDKLSHFVYFDYEVNETTGNANSTHSWATASAVTTALAQGVKVHLCVTLFANHATFFGNATARQTLITNLINLVQSRGAHGVNIDFEGVPASQKTNFTNFLVDLCNQMHAANSSYEVTMALYAVDWNSVFDIATLKNYIDLFIIMGYDYYYGGSGTAGPVGPLYSMTTGYNYNVTKSITYYQSLGCPNNKLLLGLPYYGRYWPVSGTTVPATTTGSGTSVTFKVYKTNSNGRYNNRLWENNSFTPYYNFTISGAQQQAFIDDGYSMGKRFDLVNQRGIAGIGIWALGYDDGFNDWWYKIRDKFTTCKIDACSDTLYDMGGPTRNYYDKENYTYTVAPAGASQVNINFSSFATEPTYDSLYIYNGTNTTSPVLGAYSGTTIPTSLTSGPVFTLRFKSDNATNAAGYKIIYNCVTNVDNTPPTTTVNAPTNWQTTNFSTTFTDGDGTGTGVEKSFYQVIDYNGVEWRANHTRGFFSDNFDSSAINPEWTIKTGSWSINANHYLEQSNASLSNTNIYAPLKQNLSNRYLYHWSGAIGGTGTTRRAGFHFFSDIADSTNRGNSYFVWFRLDDDKIQIYKTVIGTTNTFGSPLVDIAYNFNANQFYDYKITYDRISGVIKVFVNDDLSATYTDPSPLSNGNYISLRSGNANWQVNNLKVYRSRAASVTINVGTAANADIRYQNPDPLTPSGRIKSIVVDNVNLLSNIASQDVNVDWTESTAPFVEDGTTSDIDTTYDPSYLDANWAACIDTNSAIQTYYYSIGTSPGATDVLIWQNNGTSTSVNATGLNLIVGETYYINVYAVNGAGIYSDTTSSDGQILVSPNGLPTLTNGKWNVMPNPGNGIFILENANNNVDSKILIYDLSGKLVYEVALPKETVKYNFDLNYLSDGVYIIQISNKNNIQRMKYALVK